MRFLCAACVLLAVIVSASSGDEPLSNLVLATVNGEGINAAEVQRELTTALGRRKLSDAARKIYEAQTLEQLINRRVVQLHLNKSGVGATDAEVDQAIAVQTEQLKIRGETMEHHLKQAGMSHEQVRRQIAWQLSWQRFLDSQLTDSAMEAHFAKHRRDVDGTRLRVSQILLKPMGTDATEPEKLIAQAKKIRQGIVDGRLTFAEAAKKHSQAPTATAGGDQGFISRHGENVEAFARAAFALDKGEISQPIVTQFGVHLIQCTDVMSGTKTLSDVREELSQSLASELFLTIAQANRRKVKVEYLREPGGKPPEAGRSANTPS